MGLELLRDTEILVAERIFPISVRRFKAVAGVVSAWKALWKAKSRIHESRYSQGWDIFTQRASEKTPQG